MNKVERRFKKVKISKKLLMTILVGVLALTMVNAGLMIYYGQVTASIEVTQPITVTGTLEYTLENAMAGDTVEGAGSVTISNSADFPTTIVILNDAPEGINVIYDYVACSGNWCVLDYQILEGNTITIPAKIDTFNGHVYLKSSYELDNMLESGIYIVTTTIDQVE